MNDIENCLRSSPALLMEGALGERLKREFGLRFHEQIAMAALLYDEKGKAALQSLWKGYAAIARGYALPFLAATPTRRANKERLAAAGLDERVIWDNVALLRSVRDELNQQMYAGGLMGCKGDAYTGEGALNRREAREFHGYAARAFAQAGADFLYAGIMPSAQEAVGMAQAMSDSGLPYLISFTIKADGCLIDGTPIAQAIQMVDEAADRPPMGFMTNCVHPMIVHQALSQPCNQTELVRSRFIGIQANTSPLFYDELDNADQLHTSEPEELAHWIEKLKQNPHFKIFGGCCGTDETHMKAIARVISGGNRNA